MNDSETFLTQQSGKKNFLLIVNGREYRVEAKETDTLLNV